MTCVIICTEGGNASLLYCLILRIKIACFLLFACYELSSSMRILLLAWVTGLDIYIVWQGETEDFDLFYDIVLTLSYMITIITSACVLHVKFVTCEQILLFFGIDYMIFYYRYWSFCVKITWLPASVLLIFMGGIGYVGNLASKNCIEIFNLLIWKCSCNLFILPWYKTPKLVHI